MTTFHKRCPPRDGSLARRYEFLRTSRSPSLERNLLIHSGMVAWMDAWWLESIDFSDLPAEAWAQRGRQETIHREGSGEQHCDLENLLPAACQSQMVGLLAGIACVVLGE